MTNVTEKLAEATECCAQGVTGALNKARSAFTNARENIIHTSAVEKTRAGARAMNDYVHKAPWPVIGGAVVVALALGFLLRRRQFRS